LLDSLLQEIGIKCIKWHFLTGLLCEWPSELRASGQSKDGLRFDTPIREPYCCAI